jgi:hypothetical protein
MPNCGPWSSRHQAIRANHLHAMLESFLPHLLCERTLVTLPSLSA